MNEEFYQAYMNGDVDGEEVMDEYGETYPDLQMIWGWVQDRVMEILMEHHEAKETGDEKRAEYLMGLFHGASHLSVKACDEVFARLKTEEIQAEEKFVKWSFLVETQS